MNPLRLLSLFTIAWVETILARRRAGARLPSWNFQFEWIVRFLRRDFAGSADWPYPKLRKDLDARPTPRRAQRLVTIREEVIGGVPVVWFTPPALRHDGALVFFHGGSYIFGSARRTHAELCARLALRIGSRVIAPEYRLAPEHPYPAALDDAHAVIRALEQRDLGADQLVLAGDSAGGNLALALQLRLRDEGAVQARAIALVSPWLDLTASRASCGAHEPFDYGQTAFLAKHARDFAQTIPLGDPRVSPLFARLEGLSPLLVQVGAAERLYDEGVELAERAARAGVAVTLDVAADMPHNPPVLADYHPAAQAALERVAHYVHAQLTRARST